jgi:antitoxin VapB
MTELELKLARIRDLLKRRSLDALLIERADNFAWATCGASAVINLAADRGAASLLVTADQHLVLTDGIEAPRLEAEEGLAAKGWKFQVSPWYDAGRMAEKITRGMRLGSDGPRGGAIDLSPDLIPIRALLTPEERDRYRELGRLCAQAMDAAIRLTRPGMTENEISALLGRESSSRGFQATVNLVATDERVYRFRHPLPTEKQLDRYAMLVLCGRKWGLVCSLTRLVHFGRLPGDLRRKAEAVAEVDAAFIAATRSGRALGMILKEGIEAYAAVGFPDEWKLHHQGGLAGYAPRELIATPNADFSVSAGQAYAWNPSITGTKSEDTILVGEDAREIITAIAGWPTVTVEAATGQVERPAILEQR